MRGNNCDGWVDEGEDDECVIEVSLDDEKRTRGELGG